MTVFYSRSQLTFFLESLISIMGPVQNPKLGALLKGIEADLWAHLSIRPFLHKGRHACKRFLAGLHTLFFIHFSNEQSFPTSILPINKPLVS